MIATPLENLGRYKTLSPSLAKAIDWLEAGGWESLPEGRHEIAEIGRASCRERV